jgi:hypothetical protein
MSPAPQTDDFGFVAAPPAPPAVDVGFKPSGQPHEDGGLATPPDDTEFRPHIPTFSEKAGHIWETATLGLFSRGPKATPAHIEGVKTEFADLPHVWGGLAAEQLLNPGNILTGVFTAGMAPAVRAAIGKAFGTYMIGGGLLQVPALHQELKNPEVSGGQKVADIGAMAGQLVLGRLAIGRIGFSHSEAAVHSLGQAMQRMKPEESGELLAKLHGATPEEAARLLYAEVHPPEPVNIGPRPGPTEQASLNAKVEADLRAQLSARAKPPASPEVAEHLIEAARQFQKLDKLQPPEVRKLNEAQKAWDEVKRVLAPASRGPKAEIAAGAMREMGGELAQRTDRAEAALSSSSKTLMAMEPEARWRAVDDIENGRPQANPELQHFANTSREIMDSRREQIQALGTGKLEHFIKDYFPHIWKDPAKAESMFMSWVAKRPLEGSKSFLKQRTIPTISEGMALGLEPVSQNPVDLLLLKAREMDKYITAQNWIAEMKAKGLVQYVPAGEVPGEGMTPINDRIATVYGPKQGAVTLTDRAERMNVEPSDVTVHGQRIMGAYYAPDEVAAVANNYLSPGLRQYATYRAYMSLSNTMNRFQLGLSAFHLGFTSLDTSISKLALALEYAGQGKIGKAAAKVAQVPVAPVSNLLRGNRVISEWMNPGTQGAEIAQAVEAIRQAGGRVKMDSIYQTTITKRMAEFWKQGTELGKVNAIWRAPFAAMEQMSRPLMEYIVPRQKLGVAADLMRMEMDRMPPDATQDQMRKAYGKVWDSVDNRMGQLVYDNLFWNKTVKDLSMASVRAVGWDLGTIRELGGGVVDTGKFLKGLMTPGEEAKFTHRMAYTISLPIFTGVIGATYQYLRTGKGPEELRDYFFPKTGEKDPQGRDIRMTLPTYMKDVYHYAHDPVSTISGKVSPFPAIVAQMLRNKDYFGRDIRNADDPLVKQMLDEVKYFAKSYEPIGIRQAVQSKLSGQPPGEAAAAFVGVTRAPAWVGETAAEQLAGKLASGKFQSGKPFDAEKVARRQKIAVALRSGTDEQKLAAREQLAEMESSGEITRQARRNLIKGTEHTYLENQVGHLDANEAMRVFKQANKEERASIAEAVRLKIIRAHLPAEDRKALMEEFEKLQPKRFSLRDE